MSLDNTEKQELYEIHEKIRSGGFGVVFKGIRKSDCLKVAIKLIRKKTINLWSVYNGQKVPMEIHLMYKVKECKGCIRILDHIEKKDYFIIIMEYPYPCVDLWDFINERECIDESLAKCLFRQIIDTIIKMKEHGVLHRDIKDENILVNTQTCEIKIIDFGAGTHYTHDDLNDFQGTRVYSPPEWVKSQRYNGDKSTAWSLGILLYNIIYGDIPFEEDNDILNCKLKFNANNTNNSSHRRLNFYDFISPKYTDDAIDLIKKCLSIDENERIQLEDIQTHCWLA